MTVGKPVEEARREKITGPSGIDHFGHRSRCNLENGLGCDHQRSASTHGHCGHTTISTYLGHRLGECVRFVERSQLFCVTKEEIDPVGDQRTKVVTMAINAERIRQRERYQTTGIMRSAGGMTERSFGVVTVIEVALHVEHLAIRNDVEIKVIGRQQTRRTEIRVHRALCIGGDDNDTAAGWHTVGVSTRRKVHPDRA